MLLALIQKLIDWYFAVIPRLKPHFVNVNNALVIAHRGAHNPAKGIIENTQEAFQLAQETGCWGIELDVRATKDNVLIVNHDDTLNRLWHHDVAIANLSFSELRALEPRIPSLSEVISEYGNRMHLFIELKTPFENEDVLVHTLQNLTPCKDYHLLSLHASTFKFLSHFPKHSLLLVAVHNNVKEFCELSLRERYGGVLGSYFLLTNKVIKKLQEANQHVGVGYVDSKNSLYRELTRGMEWIFTNEAVKVNQYLQNL